MNTTLLFGGLATAIGTTTILIWRVREGQTPVRLGKIIAPPLGMSTGFCMFFKQEMRFPLEWGIVAFLLGFLIFAWPLILTSRLHKKDGQIWMKRSPAFFVMLLALVTLRISLRSQIEHFISLQQTAGLMFTLAFGMVLHWRIRMLFEFKRLTSAPGSSLKEG